MNLEPLHGPKVKADLDYTERVHMSAKNFRPKTRLFEATIGMAEKVGKKKRKSLELELSRALVSCPRV
jgi:hypothetical protein